jgi:hypothetical protein
MRCALGHRDLRELGCFQHGEFLARRHGEPEAGHHTRRERQQRQGEAADHQNE